MCSSAIHLEASLSLSVPRGKVGVIIAPRMNGRIEGEIPFKAPTHTRCSVAVTYVNKGDGRLWNHNFSFNLYCNISCFTVKGSDVIVWI